MVMFYILTFYKNNKLMIKMSYGSLGLVENKHWCQGSQHQGQGPEPGSRGESYTPARTAPWNPYPFSGTKFAKPYPYWHKIWAKIHTLTGTNSQKRVPFVAQLLLKSGSLVQLLGGVH